MAGEWFRFVLAALAVWRVTHFLQAEDGPWDLSVRLRRAAGQGFWGALLDCFYCLSLWVAAPFALLVSEEWMIRLLAWPALSAAAILLERPGPQRPAPPPAVRYWEEETSDELLRR